MGIGGPQPVLARERGHQQQQRRARQVEVGDERIDRTERVGRHDVFAGPAAGRRERAARGVRHRLQCAHARGAHRDQAAAVRARRAHGGSRGRTDIEPLLLHVVVTRVVGGDGPERAGPDMQRDRGSPDATRGEFRQERMSEVQPGGGRGHGPLDPRVHGLIALEVMRTRRAFDIGRQRDLALRSQHGIERTRDHAHRALALLAERRHLHHQGAVRRGEPRAERRMLRGPAQHAPRLGSGFAGRSHEQHLDSTTRGALQEQSRRAHTRLVHDQQIARTQEVADRRELRVDELVECAVDDEQPGRVAPLGRVLRDQGLGQVVVQQPHACRGLVVGGHSGSSGCSATPSGARSRAGIGRPRCV